MNGVNFQMLADDLRWRRDFIELFHVRNPNLERILPQMTVIVPTVTSHFFTDEIGLFERFIGRFQLYFGHHQSFVVTVELIDFKGMSALAAHQEARLVNGAWLAQFKQMVGLVQGDFFLEFVTAHAAVGRWPLNSEISPVATDAYPDSASVTTEDITLFDAVGSVGLLLVVGAADQKLPLNFHAAHGVVVQATMKLDQMA